MDFVQSFRLAAPEVLFSLSGLVLLLGAAWSRSDAGARVITWLAVAVVAIGVPVAILAGLWALDRDQVPPPDGGRGQVEGFVVGDG